jgi:hypothetical protein
MLLHEIYFLFGQSNLLVFLVQQIVLVLVQKVPARVNVVCF